MFCPRCGSNQREDLKFCKSCGANLHAVMQVVDEREPEQKFDWTRTWMAEIFMSTDERRRLKEVIQRQRGITPEIKRHNEIKAGVIVGGVGIAVAIFLYIFMGGLIASGKVSPEVAEILSRLWVAGVIPLFVGLALIINGAVVSKKLIEATRRGQGTGAAGLADDSEAPQLRSADTNEFLSAPFSVTEQTTKHLGGSARKE